MKTTWVRFAFVITLIAASLPFASAAKKRVWLEATVVDTQSSRQSRITGSSTTGQVDQQGNISANTQTQRQSWDEYTYVVDAGDRLYLIGEKIGRAGYTFLNFATSRALFLTPGAKVQYAIEQNNFVVLVPDPKDSSKSKEHKFSILRQELKTNNNR